MPKSVGLKLISEGGVHLFEVDHMFHVIVETNNIRLKAEGRQNFIVEVFCTEDNGEHTDIGSFHVKQLDDIYAVLTFPPGMEPIILAKDSLTEVFNMIAYPLIAVLEDE